MGGRRIRCPDGRPVYRVDELPPYLATVTRLRLLRRRLAPEQLPVASLLFMSSHGWRYAALYRVDEAVRLPPLPPAREAAWLAARTCARCAGVSELRLPEVDARRVCSRCADLECRAAWQVRQNARRTAGRDWARGVLGDPAAVLVAETVRGWDKPFGVYAVRAASGEVLVDELLVCRRAGQRPADWPEAACVETLLEPLLRLDAARLVGYRNWALAKLADEVAVVRHTHWADQDRAFSFYVPAADQFAVRFSAWLGHRPPSWPWRFASPDPSCSYEYAHVGEEAPDPHTSVGQMREMLHRMADDDHPAGPPTCPALVAGTGAQACGAGGVLLDGLCPTHSPATAAASTGTPEDDSAQETR